MPRINEAAVDHLTGLVADIQGFTVDLSRESGRRGFAEGINAAFEIIQHHVDVETALAIGEALLARLNHPEA